MIGLRSARLSLKQIAIRKNARNIIHPKGPPNGLAGFRTGPACRDLEDTHMIVYAAHDLKALSGDARRWPTRSAGATVDSFVAIPAGGSPRLSPLARARTTVA